MKTSLANQGLSGFLLKERLEVNSHHKSLSIPQAFGSASEHRRIGCATNIASALLLEPAIADKIVVVWRGGHDRDWPDTNEFNLMQDVYASQVLFDSGVPLFRFPCARVGDADTPKRELCFNHDFRHPLCREGVHVRRDLIFRRVFQLINGSGKVTILCRKGCCFAFLPGLLDVCYGKSKINPKRRYSHA